MCLGCPDAYWELLLRYGYGYGQIRGSDEPDNYPAHFEFSRELISATNEYYKDNLIYEHGAKGDVLFFGFDKGDKYALFVSMSIK